MNRNRVESHRKQFKGNIDNQWDGLADGQLDLAGGIRGYVSMRIQETGGTSSDDEAERELSNWLQRLNEIDDSA